MLFLKKKIRTVIHVVISMRFSSSSENNFWTRKLKRKQMVKNWIGNLAWNKISQAIIYVHIYSYTCIWLFFCPHFMQVKGGATVSLKILDTPLKEYYFVRKLLQFPYPTPSITEIFWYKFFSMYIKHLWSIKLNKEFLYTFYFVQKWHFIHLIGQSWLRFFECHVISLCAHQQLT